MTRVTALIRRADVERLHEQPAWLALLHYDTTLVPGRVRGRASTPGFRLSADGDPNPRAEPHATLRAFIARRHWLTRRLGLRASDPPRVTGPRYDRWHAGLDAHGLTLIFPEGFVKNPVPMFSHTLLRIDARCRRSSAAATPLTTNSATSTWLVG